MAYNPISLQYIPQYQGDEGLILHFPPTSSATFVKGDVILAPIAATGTIIEAANTAGVVNTAQVLLGVAAQDALTVATPGTAAVIRTLTSIQCFRSQDLWVVRTKNAASNTFVVATHLNQAARSLWRAAAGNYQVDLAVSTGGYARVFGSAEYISGVGAVTPILSATQGGPIYIKLTAAATMFGVS